MLCVRPYGSNAWFVGVIRWLGCYRIWRAATYSYNSYGTNMYIYECRVASEIGCWLVFRSFGLKNLITKLWWAKCSKYIISIKLFDPAQELMWPNVQMDKCDYFVLFPFPSWKCKVLIEDEILGNIPYRVSGLFYKI